MHFLDHLKYGKAIGKWLIISLTVSVSLSVFNFYMNITVFIKNSFSQLPIDYSSGMKKKITQMAMCLFNPIYRFTECVKLLVTIHQIKVKILFYLQRGTFIFLM